MKVPTCQVGLGISVSCTIPTRHRPFPSTPPPLLGLKDLLHLKQTHAVRHDHTEKNIHCCRRCCVRVNSPGLKRTMARKQPNSVLSICISFILDTNSVRTLQENK